MLAHRVTKYTINAYVLSGCPCGTSPLLYFLGEPAGSDLVSLFVGDIDRLDKSGPLGLFIPGGVSVTI